MWSLVYEIAAPIFIIAYGFVAGLAVSDFESNKIEHWLAVISYVLLVAGALLVIRAPNT